MKFIKYIFLAVLTVGIWSCDDDDSNITVLPGETLSGSSTLNTPTVQEFTVTETTDSQTGNETEVATEFTWSAVTGNYNGAVLYNLQIDIEGNNFRNAVNLPSTSEATTELSKEVTMGELNVAVNQINTTLVQAGSALAVNFTQPTNFQVRVVSTSTAGDATYSEPIVIAIQAYEKIVIAEPKLYLVGSVQQYYGVSAWNPEQALEMRYIGDGTTKVFEGYIKANAGDIFKFISNQAIWDDVVGNYGTIGGAQDGNLENSGGSGNIEITEQGNYYVKVDTDNLTYSLVKMEWGIIGSATPEGWSNETPMTYNFNDNQWEITLDLTAGEAKFRSASLGQAIFGEDWKFNVGTNLTAWDEGDGNFSVGAGNATITLSFDVTGMATVNGI